jgi:nucleoside-diphosphate kinase
VVSFKSINKVFYLKVWLSFNCFIKTKIFLFDMGEEVSFGLIKPEGIERKLVEEIERRISDSGLEIVREKEVVMKEEQFELVYGHAKEKIPNTYDMMKEYMTSNTSKILEVRGENAVERLLKLRGASNARYAAAGTIRGDFARDQDYDVAYDQGKLALNVFHASDSADEAKIILKTFFNEE